jgi:hypothetical protein
VTLTALRIASAERYAERDDYEWVTATAALAVDPDHLANRRIVDLDAAPRDEDGLVTFDADVRILRPAVEPDELRLLLVVPNRGLVGGVPFSVGAPLVIGAAGAHPPQGDGFVLDDGWTVVWCGWQWDVLQGLGLRAPVADVAPGWIRAEWRSDAPLDVRGLSDSSPFFEFAAHPTADLEDPDAVLTVRTSPGGDKRVVPRARWRFTDERHIELDGGFEAFHWYELVYRTDHCPVGGVGLLALRDLVSHLRAEASRSRALAFGVSQSGRVLRQFLYEGLNQDEHGRPVFDGVFAHIASSRRGEFNQRYGQPSYTHVLGFSNLPPFDTGSVLARQRQIAGAPKLIETNSSWEYWRGDGALLHVDPATGDDLVDDPDVRMYLLCGFDHLGLMPGKELMPAANPVHDLDCQLVLRALFVALDRWVRGSEAPPPSRVPRRSDGTAVSRDDVLHRFGHVATPDPDVLNVTPCIDLGPEAERGIGRWPLVAGAPYPAFVAAVDDDGNEVGGVRVPEIEAPLAVFTGWNPRRPIEGLPDVLYEFLGSRLPFPPDRPSLGDRYPDEATYEAAARAAAEALAVDRLLLDVDVERAVDAAVARYRTARSAS